MARTRGGGTLLRQDWARPRPGSTLECGLPHACSGWRAPRPWWGRVGERGVGHPVLTHPGPSPPSRLPRPGLLTPGPRRRQPSPRPRRPRRRRASPGSLPKSSPLPSSTGKTVSLLSQGPWTPPTGCAPEPPASALHPSCLPHPLDSGVLHGPQGCSETLSLLCPTRWLPSMQELWPLQPLACSSVHI